MTVMDLTPLTAAVSDRLTADDLIGGPRVITITGVKGAIMEGKEKALFSFEGDQGRPFIPCKTMVRVMMAIWGKYANEFVGRRLMVYRDPEVTFGALATGGVRISHMSHMPEPVTVVVQAKKGKKGPIKILPLKDEPAQDKPDPAAKFARAYIAKVNAAEDRVALEQYVDEKAERLAELKAKRPELYAECDAALEKRRAEFAPEGKPVEDTGEAFTDDDDTFDDTDA